MDDHQAIELPPLPIYRQKQAIEAYEEAQEIMNPESVQIAHTIIGYLQSGEFFWLLIIVALYRLVRHVVDTIPDAVQKYCAWMNRR